MQPQHLSICIYSPLLSAQMALLRMCRSWLCMSIYRLKVLEPFQGSSLKNSKQPGRTSSFQTEQNQRRGLCGWISHYWSRSKVSLHFIWPDGKMLGLTEILHTLKLGTHPKQMRKSLYGAFARPAMATLGVSGSNYCHQERACVKRMKHREDAQNRHL